MRIEVSQAFAHFTAFLIEQLMWIFILLYVTFEHSLMVILALDSFLLHEAWNDLIIKSLLKSAPFRKL
jgi:hypothetical protein